LVCIERYKGFKYRRFRQQRGSRWNRFGVGGGVDVQRRWGEHGVWVRRGSVREEQNWNKEITKGGNDKIGREKGRSDILEKGRRGRPEQDLTV